jgi:predicted  nucleic acid-binding Zn-ribbon protein
MKLQEVDFRRGQHQVEEKALPERLQIAEQVLQKKKEELAQLQAKSAEMDKGKRDKEMDLKVQEEQVVKLRDRLIKLKTNEEYKANLKEIENAKVRKGELEESLLVSMEEGDNLKKEIAARTQGVTEAEQTFQSEKEKIEEAIKMLSVTASSIEAEWVSLSEMSDKNILEDYKKLIIKRKGLAVVPLNGNICGGCHFSIPPQVVAQVRTGEKILTCTYCHRMLYAPAKIE